MENTPVKDTGYKMMVEYLFESGYVKLSDYKYVRESLTSDDYVYMRYENGKWEYSIEFEYIKQ